MKKSRPITTSNWTTGLNSGDIEMGSRTNLIVQKKKKKTQAEKRTSQLSKSSSRETQFNESDGDKSSDNSVPTIASLSFEEVQSSGKKSSKSMQPKSIDVVVDIHREYKEKNAKGKVSGRKSVLYDKTNERSKNSEKSKLQRMHDDAKVIDSLDLIEELQDSSLSTLTNENVLETASRSDFMKEDNSKTIVHEISRNRRQWGEPESINDSLQKPQKPPRKRWSKDTTVIRLPETRSISPLASSLENVSPLDEDTKPVPMPRASLKHDEPFAFDNEAFITEAEEVLRIETDHRRESTKIEIRQIGDTIEDLELSSLSDPSTRSSLHERRSRQDTVITIEEGIESRNEGSVRSMERKESTVISIENTEDSDDGRRYYSPKRKASSSRLKKQKNSSRSRHDSDESNDSTSGEKQSNYASSEELVKSQSWTSRRAKSRGSSVTRSHSYFSQDTLSTNDDEVSDDDRSKGRNKIREKTRSRSEENENGSKKRKQRGKIATNDISPTRFYDSNVKVDTMRKKKKKRKKKKEEAKEIKYICITIHRADMLEVDFITKHPMVKIHIVEAETGNYLKSIEDTSSAGYLQPAITGKFDFKENRSMIPVWEEELIFEHDFDTLLKTGKEQILILFEIIDLLTFAEASITYDKFGNEDCWYKVAWAFLKPVGRNNTLHTDKKVRLQLYRPRRNPKNLEKQKCEAYAWWKSNIREKYPSSLFVTVASVDLPKLEPVIYQQLSLYDLSDLNNESQRASARISRVIDLPKWTRLEAQSCKIPNDSIFESEASENGCFFVAFSNNGKYVACAFSEEYDYPIIVYEVETTKIHVPLAGHKTFVYSLNWSNDDHQLLSVSSDQTARIWNIQAQVVQHIEMMPHPSYVYCGKFDPGNTLVVATGCYDRIARIWIKAKKSGNYELSQELEGHEGFVNSMCFQKNGNLLTADNVGVIILWALKRNRKMPLRKEWHISRKIKVREIEGVPINTIILHPLESRLLVHSRNNGLRMLDLASGIVLQRYNGLNNQRIQSTACISPCAGLIFCGGEDSSLNVWNLETGKYLAKYSLERNFRAVTCVDYHSVDHMIVFSTFGSPAPIRILKYNKDTNGESVGLRLIDDESSMHNKDVAMESLNHFGTPGRSRSINRRFIENETSKDASLELANTENLSNPVSKHSSRSKLQYLQESEQVFKSRSANRLHNIIERIDRILSNSSHSPDDLESGRNPPFVQEEIGRRVSTSRSSSSHKYGKDSSNTRSVTTSHIEEHSGSYFGTSTTDSVGNEEYEMEILHSDRKIPMERKVRSKSAKTHRQKDVIEDDLSKTFSDSAANFRKRQFNDRALATQYKSKARSNLIQQSRHTIKPSSRSLTSLRTKDTKSELSSSPNSTGTYVVEKADVEANNDRNSVKTSKHSESSLNITESERSTMSDATFTIEKPNPIPKPRRKNIPQSS